MHEPKLKFVLAEFKFLIVDPFFKIVHKFT